MRTHRITRALALLAMLASAAGCNATRTGEVSPTIRICDTSGCSERDRATASFVPDDSGKSPLLQDPDRYAGESAQDLRAAAENGSAAAADKLGQMHLYGLGGTPKSAARAAGWFRSAADAGHPWAQYRLGQMLADGRGVTADRRRSLELMEAAAAQGHPLAAHHLGLLAQGGKGVPADAATAARWFAVAAEGGVADAQYNLGLLLHRGQGVERDLYQGLQWMRRAAENGNLQAQTAVGRLYLTGLDTMGQDVAEAETWLGIAAGRGDAAAKSLLAQLRKQREKDEDFRRKLMLLQAETERAWASAVLASWLTAPRIDYVVVW
ncbi:TPR repeat protein [Azospirillum agricola]|uniref:tetratricopeptide repeat protein n=1 Tax=Azospirillum agricola TaxID=1720247 RepID=UPI001AE5B793|nr:tetratricopeptide repeat protein [Azospirillum agricola]MBP2226862.1 TPR repeat protein [Azospirillum agricola]